MATRLPLAPKVHKARYSAAVPLDHCDHADLRMVDLQVVADLILELPDLPPLSDPAARQYARGGIEFGLAKGGTIVRDHKRPLTWLR